MFFTEVNDVLYMVGKRLFGGSFLSIFVMNPLLSELQKLYE